VTLAAYAAYLRIAQHGFTNDRVWLLATLLVAGCYAVGYGAAAILRGGWLKRLETTNIAGAFIVVVVMLALLTPVADPARLSVADQMRRLESGIVTVDAFDFKFLRFDGGRYGIAALEQLKSAPPGPNGQAIAIKATEALLETDRYAWDKSDANDIAEQIEVYPTGTVLPVEFLEFMASEEAWICQSDDSSPLPCMAILIDLDADNVDEIVLQGKHATSMYQKSSSGEWSRSGCHPKCNDRIQKIRDGIKSGDIKIAPPLMMDVIIGGERVHF
jgi:Domain of unknown function (DUF4153)